MKFYFNKLLLLTLLILSSATAYANSPSTVDSKHCGLLKNTDKPFILVLKPGEELTQSITDCANAANLPSASLVGLGMLREAKIAYYNINEQRYQYKKFSGLYELTSLTGNIGFSEGKRFAHIHVTLGDDDYQLIGGHLAEAIAGPTVEVTFIPLETAFTRNYNKETEAKLIIPNK